MTLEESEILQHGDVLFVDKLYDGGVWLNEVGGAYVANRKGEGTKIIFTHHHHHLPEFLFCKDGESVGIYHHDEVISRVKLTRNE